MRRTVARRKSVRDATDHASKTRHRRMTAGFGGSGRMFPDNADARDSNPV